MGVHGLWRLIESSGKPVPLETLENKVLAVDISIWLHQAVKGFQDARGSSVPNAHLLGVYHRLCKLLYYRIRPVFVFDGGVPMLKKQTIIKRNQLKYHHEDESERLHQEILNTLLKQSAIDSVLIENLTQPIKKSPVKISRKDNDNNDDMFKLPEIPKEFSSKIQENSESEMENNRPHKYWVDIDTFNEKDEKFLALPADVRHDILTDIKENNKRTSWKKLYVTPAENGEFSKFQIQRVLKRRSLQVSLEEAEKEMGGHSLSLGDLEALLCQEGIVTASKMAATRRIASDENSRFLFIKNIQKTKEEMIKKLKVIDEQTENGDEKSAAFKTEGESCQFESDVQKAIELSKVDIKHENLVDDSNSLDSLTETPATSKSTESSSSMIKNGNLSELESDLQKAINLSKIDPDFHDKPSTSYSLASIHPEVENQIKKTENISNIPSTSALLQDEPQIKAEESDPELEAAIRLSLEPEQALEKLHDDTSYLNNFKDGDFIFESSSDDEIKATPVAKGSTSLAKAYLTEYSDLTPLEIERFLNSERSKTEVKPKDFYLNEMILNTPKQTKLKEKDVQELIQDLTSDPEDLEGIGILSDSNSDESDDFVEVDDATPSKPALEVVIKPENEGVDDLFADVFQSNSEILPEKISEKEATEPEIIQEEKLNDVPLEVETNTPVKDTTSEDGLKPVETEEKKEDPNVISKNLKDKVKPKISKEELMTLKENLEAERENLLKEKAHEERMANSITDQMYKDTQDLLRLFGVPYIIAPQEAEAQCAFLDDTNLTDGTITDDSDIWLFGGKTVYKNFFNHKKHVLEFRAENIQHHFKMSRHQLILLALLVGSDYTLGIQGVGPVTALEILAAFPPSKQETILTQDELVAGLRQFKHWWQSGRVAGPGRQTLRNKLKNISLLEGFPSTQVVNAYLQPEVDPNKETFSWGKPNVEKLREFARTKFGWSDIKCNEILMPVMKRWEDPKAQKSILAYFNKRPLKNSEISLSKRVKKAVHRLGMDNSESEDEFDVEGKSQTRDDSVVPGEKTKVKRATKKGAKTKGTSKKGKPEEPKVVTLDVDIKPLNKVQEKLAKFQKPAPNKYEEFIPQREKNKINALKTKLRAIELYRKSTSGPGYVKKRQKPSRKVKDEAELSENSSDDD